MSIDATNKVIELIQEQYSKLIRIIAFEILKDYDKKTSIIVWQIGEYTLELNTVLDQDKAIEIANKVFIIK